MLAGCAPSDAGSRALTPQPGAVSPSASSQPSDVPAPSGTGSASTAPTEGPTSGSGTPSGTGTDATPDGSASGSPSASSKPGASSKPAPSGKPSPSQTEGSGKPSPSTKPGQPLPAGSVNCAKVKCVALTFDDGPGPYTQQVLDTLESAGARATFFVVGTQVKAHPGLVKAQVKAGMELGNHSWDHPNLEGLSMAQVRREFSRVDQEVKSLTGVTPRFVRPPEGALTKTQKNTLHRPLAYWGVDTLDWKTRNKEATIKAASKAKAGDIVLMHDIHPQSAAAVPQIVKNLQAKGIHLVTISELIGSHPKDGVGYGWGKRP